MSGSDGGGDMFVPLSDDEKALAEAASAKFLLNILI